MSKKISRFADEKLRYNVPQPCAVGDLEHEIINLKIK